jgi:hypothetical protein
MVGRGFRGNPFERFPLTILSHSFLFVKKAVPAEQDREKRNSI